MIKINAYVQVINRNKTASFKYSWYEPVFFFFHIFGVGSCPARRDYNRAGSNVGLGGVTSMIAGPKRVMESVSLPAGSAFVMKTYVWP